MLGCVLIPTTITNTNNKGFYASSINNALSRIFPITGASLDNVTTPIVYISGWNDINNTFRDIS